MSTFSTYKTDRKKEEEGEWVQMADGSRWKIARAASHRARKAIRDAQRPYMTVIRQCEQRDEMLPADVDDKINVDWAVNGIVIDWKGVTGPDGKEMKFNEKNLRFVLTELPDLLREVIAQASRASNFRESLDREAEDSLGEG